jgi:hypothetical protein
VVLPSAQTPHPGYAVRCGTVRPNAALDASSREWLDDIDALAAEPLADDAKADERIEWDVEQIKRWVWG